MTWNEFKLDATELFYRVLGAATRVAAFLACVGLHKATSWGLQQMLASSEWPHFIKACEAVVTTSFVVVYCDLAIETVTIFIPALAKLRAKIVD